MRNKGCYERGRNGILNTVHLYKVARHSFPIKRHAGPPAALPNPLRP
jgi:hypothetical protein